MRVYLSLKKGGIKSNLKNSFSSSLAVISLDDSNTGFVIFYLSYSINPTSDISVLCLNLISTDLGASRAL